MEQLAKIVYSRKVNKCMMYFSIFAFIFWMALAVDTILHGRSIWFIIGDMLFALLALFAFRASRKCYRMGK